TATNNKLNGTSTRVVKLADAIKSRTASKDLKLAAKAPTEVGRLSKRKSSTRSMTFAEIRISTSLLALSTTRERVTVKSQLNSSTVTTPAARAHKVSVALFGTTLS